MKNWLRDSAFGILHHLNAPSNHDSLFSASDAWSDWREMVTVLIPLFSVLAIVFIGGHFAGYQEGLARGQRDAAIISAPMNSGFAVKDAWASILSYNDPVSELADCKKKIFVGAEGQRFCEMPVWLDPSPPPPVAPIPRTASHEGFSSHKWWWPFSP